MTSSQSTSHGPRTDPAFGYVLRAVAACLLALAMMVRPALTQEVRAGDASFDAIGFSLDDYLELTALMEVTILNIDVLTLTVRVPPETAERLRALSGGSSYDEALADSVAAVILDADEVWARQRFHRDVSYGRLSGGILETVGQAVDAGYVGEAYRDTLSERLPELFGFLREDGAKDGDQILYHAHGDTLRTVYRTVDGDILLDRTNVSVEGRRAAIPGFFAPRTRFRKRLVESLLARAGS